jgi:uncharacterized protein with GYD domain
MPKYVVFFSYSGAAIKNLIRRPEGRTEAVKQLVESAGGRLESYYLMLGEYDGLAIFEVPNSELASAISLTVSQTGVVTKLETHELINPDHLSSIASTAKSLTYTPPGAV